MIPVYVIVAVDSSGGISKDNNIPWNVKEDLMLFKDTTTFSNNGKSNIMIMGKNTYYKLPKNFKFEGRKIYVISKSMYNLKSPEFYDENLKVFGNLKNSLTHSSKEEYNKIFICGGKRIYDEICYLKLDDEKIVITDLYLTQIHQDYECDNKLEVSKLLKNENTHELNMIKKNNFTLEDSYSKNFVNITFTKYSSNECENKDEQKYLDLMCEIYKHGENKGSRNSLVKSTFGNSLKFDLLKFPILTTKKVPLKIIFEELIWFLKGCTNANVLKEKGINIWNGNTTRKFLDDQNLNHYEEGDIGPMYGFNLRHHGEKYEGMNKNYDGKGFDQIKYCVELLHNDPNSRRIIMSTYNPSVAKEGCLFPCHGVFIQFYVKNKNELCCMMTQRSADYLCGVPFNISSYSLLVYMMCEILNMKPGYLIINFGDTHIYEDHYKFVIRQLLRDPISFPTLSFRDRNRIDICDFEYGELNLSGYNHYSHLPIKMIV